MSKPSKEVLDRIRNNGQQVRAAATELTKRIKAFEAWLGKLPGRVTAETQVASDEDGVVSTYLAYQRQASDWALVLYRYENAHDVVLSETLLRDAPLETKLWVINHFNNLLEAIARSQEEIVNRAREASASYDEIAERFGIKGEV